MNKAILVIIIAIMIAPIWFTATGSVQDLYGVFIMPPRILPVENFTLVNYQWVVSRDVGRWFVNTVIAVVGTVSLSVFISVTGGYAFSVYQIPAKRLIWSLLLAGIMIPRMSMLVPLFVITRKLRISGSLLAVILPTAFSPIGLYLSRAYFETIPRSLLESARLDGANEWRVLRSIVAPVSRPIVTACGLFAAVGTLNDYLWQMLQLQRPDDQTLLVGLIRETMRRGGEILLVNPIGRSLAAAMVLLAPLLGIFIVANRYFTSALGGAIKE